MDFDFVNNRVAAGAQIDDDADVQQLAAAGVNVVVNARDDFDDEPLLSQVSGMRYLWNPVADDGQVIPASYWQTTLDFVLPLLAQPGNKILLHCREGISRGPCNTLAVLMAVGLTDQSAKELIFQGRPQSVLTYEADVVAAIHTLGYA